MARQQDASGKGQEVCVCVCVCAVVGVRGAVTHDARPLRVEIERLHQVREEPLAALSYVRRLPAAGGLDGGQAGTRPRD